MDRVVPIARDPDELNFVAKSGPFGQIGVSLSLVVGELRTDSNGTKTAFRHTRDAVFKSRYHIPLPDLELRGVSPVARAIESVTARKETVIVDEDYSALAGNRAIALTDIFET